LQEYDALPDIGHACGHNLIAVSSLAAALATKAWLEEDPTRVGTVKLFGTPVLLSMIFA
jgi:metal-dependent amidase/aminoacylase/carboxypeptidase family protein